MTKQREARPAIDFYARAVEDGEALYEAAEIEGIDGEVALLRRELRRHAEREEVNLDVLQRSIGQLVRAVVARHRLSEASAGAMRDGLVTALAGLLADIEPVDEV